MSDFQNSSSLDSKDAKENSKEESKEDESLWEQEQLPDIGTGDSEHGEESEPEIESELTSENDKEEAREQESRFKDGQILRFVKVRFSGNAKAFPFFIGKRQFSYGQTVVAMSDRGMMVGYINSFPYERAFDKSLHPIRSIARVATAEDIKQQEDFVIKEKESERICLGLIEKYKLDMVLTHVEYTQFGKKAVFFFTAPARVDFLYLVK
ncbi:MAG: PSP1 domain-containing protein [Bdellovibrionota bacterium]